MTQRYLTCYARRVRSNDLFSGKLPNNQDTCLFSRPLTPVTLRLAGATESVRHWSATLNVTADDLSLRIRKSSEASTIEITLSSCRPLAEAISPRCFAALFHSRFWAGFISAAGNHSILAFVNGPSSSRRDELALSFTKQIDRNSWLSVTGKWSCFELVRTPLPAIAHDRSYVSDDNGKPDVDQYLDQVRFAFRSQRLRRGYSLQQMSEVCGLSKTTIGDLERGNQKITAAHLYRISCGLGIEVSELASPRRSENPDEAVTRKSPTICPGD